MRVQIYNEGSMILPYSMCGTPWSGGFSGNAVKVWYPIHVHPLCMWVCDKTWPKDNWQVLYW